MVWSQLCQKNKSWNCKSNACDRWWEIYHHQSPHINATGKDLLPKLPLLHSQSSAVDAFGGSLAKDLTQKLGHVCIKDKSNYRFDYYLCQTMVTGGTNPPRSLPLCAIGSLWNENIWSRWKISSVIQAPADVAWPVHPERWSKGLTRMVPEA